MRVYYSDKFVLPLPDGHRFPMSKYSRLRQRVETELGDRIDLCVAPAVAIEDLKTAHHDDYIQRVIDGSLSSRDVRALGFPWSPELVERSRRSVGATIAACRDAFVEGRSVSLAGGTHHAFADRPQGFCVFNDSVVAARVLRRSSLLNRVAVIDCDVHQGNGTASLVRNDPDIFSFSIHGEKNFPTQKEQSDLDIAVPDQAGDAIYIRLLEQGIASMEKRFKPELVIYLAGADPYRGDRWGRTGLSRQGLRRRDDLVIGWCEAQAVPLAVTMAGGYAKDIDAIVDIHFNTVLRALESDLVKLPVKRDCPVS